MAWYHCMNCGKEAHYTEFVAGTNASAEDFDGDSDDEPEVDLACPECESDSVVEL
jgi:DNA-directed RNA polymerase subunit RPC12/RpoP